MKKKNLILTSHISYRNFFFITMVYFFKLFLLFTKGALTLNCKLRFFMKAILHHALKSLSGWAEVYPIVPTPTTHLFSINVFCYLFIGNLPNAIFSNTPVCMVIRDLCIWMKNSIKNSIVVQYIYLNQKSLLIIEHCLNRKHILSIRPTRW